MDDTLNKEENVANIYVIKRKLAELKRSPARNFYEYDVGRFTVYIFAYDIQDIPKEEIQSIVQCKTVDVIVVERNKDNAVSSISIRDDARFKDYKPIQYDVISTFYGTTNVGTGNGMPIIHLCELIRYLHRLSNLTAFM